LQCIQAVLPIGNEQWQVVAEVQRACQCSAR
jgi:hypothetical protein